jgi:hypothetical protein
MGACSMGQRMLSLSVKAFWGHMHVSKGLVPLAKLAQRGLLAQLGLTPGGLTQCQCRLHSIDDAALPPLTGGPLGIFLAERRNAG